MKTIIDASYKLEGRTTFQGLQISIENGVGSVRKGVDKVTGKPWRTVMRHPYGYIRLTEGVDGDHVDCFIGPNKDATHAYVIHQNDPNTGKYDEDKVMLGFDSAEAAKKAYFQNYDRPEAFFDSIEAIPMEDFKKKAHATKERPAKIAAQQQNAKFEAQLQLFAKPQSAPGG